VPRPVQQPLRPAEQHQRADDAVQLVPQLLVLFHVAGERGNLQTRKRLARRAERAVIARLPILTATVHNGKPGQRKRRTPSLTFPPHAHAPRPSRPTPAQTLHPAALAAALRCSAMEQFQACGWSSWFSFLVALMAVAFSTIALSKALSE
jgi:hypothetical protein